MSEEMLDNADRLAILSRVVKANPKPIDETKTIDKKIDSTTDFSTLLEESIKKQTKNSEEDEKINEEVRKEVLEKITPNFKIIDGWRF